MQPSIEDIILSHGTRGMTQVRAALTPGYCSRAAKLLQNNKGTVLIGTGFPVAGSFETDGPIGAIALYQVLEQLGYTPVFVCAPPISQVLQRTYRTHEFPIMDQTASQPLVQTALAELKPSLLVSVERAGAAADGHYYNMRKQDITSQVARFDLFFQYCQCPTIAVGDGGNEIGMGNVLPALANLPIIPCVVRCTELVIATVSNWGVYGILAAWSVDRKEDLFRYFDPAQITADLVAQGSVDGVTREATHSEDGFPITTGLEIIQRLRRVTDFFQPNNPRR
jgi:hypothetical protein